jgi:4-amino-4-deoxychorismate lyase
LFNENHPLNVGEYSLEQLKQAQAIVVTNALMGVMPVKSVVYPDTQVVEYTLDSMPQRHLSNLLHQQIQSE